MISSYSNSNDVVSPRYQAITSTENIASQNKTINPEKGILAKIWSVAGKAFLEISIVLAINCAVITFIAIPMTIPILTSALISGIVTCAVKTALELYLQRKDKEQRIKESVDNVQHLARISLIDTIGLAGPNIAIHEVGHAAAVLTCFRNPQPEIHILPFKGGMTGYTISNGLTRLGKFLGNHHSLMFVAAGGMLASTIFALFEFAIADKIKDIYPMISQFMNYHAILQLFGEVLYGITAFVASKTDLSHDFVHLWMTGGIHPLIPIALIIALPLAEIALMKCLAWRKKAESIQNAVSLTQQNQAV
jgi:hypothetical protein